MFRTVLIKQSSKIKTIQGYLVIFDGDDEKRIFLDDISMLIIEDKNSLITVPTILELVKRDISIILCDEKHNPSATVLSLNSNYANSGNISIQLEWNDECKMRVWQNIVKLKITMQIQVLDLLEKTKQELLSSYLNEIVGYDKTNREGLAAKVYFFELFGHDFQRERNATDDVINKLLNYGYAIILSCFNREIVASGYLTQIGIYHRGKQNPFNLSCDFMEPFRPILDLLVKMVENEKEPLLEIKKILTRKIKINNEQRYLDDAIRVYTQNLLRILKGESLNFPSIYLDWDI